VPSGTATGVEALKQATPIATIVLEVLSLSLPDDTYLTDFRMGARAITHLERFASGERARAHSGAFKPFPADWVILSACNTAAGHKPSAEALWGFARAFFSRAACLALAGEVECRRQAHHHRSPNSRRIPRSVAPGRCAVPCSH
jgi:hypothetical protein